MENCVFCKIIKREMETNFIVENQDVVVFNDLKPQAATHLLILPTQHVPTFMDINSTHKEIFLKMTETAQNLIRDRNLGEAYKIIFNGGKYQHVPHLHWHLLGG